MKEIWDEFKTKCKEAWDTFVKGVLSVTKSTWKILKQACIDFVAAIAAWIRDLVKGVYFVFLSLVEVIWAALLAALKATLGLLYNKIIEWIKHW